MAKGTHAQEAKAFSERLKAALAAAGVKASPAVVASEFNLRYWGKSITPHTARAWLAGVSIPMQDKVRTLSEWLHVHPDELRFGPRPGGLRANEPESWGTRMSLQDRDMLSKYLALSPANRRTVQEVVAALTTAQAVRHHKTP